MMGTFKSENKAVNSEVQSFNRRLDKFRMNLVANWLEIYRKQFGSNSNGFFRPNSIRPHS
jgi:hypothetical protein